MKKALVISEQDNIAAILENDRAVEFLVNRGELLLGDIYTASVENILPGIDAAFVNLGKDKMGFLHANDVPGQGPLKERLVPKQKLLVQITKEPTGHKGPRVSTAISLPGRFLVLVPEERGVSISRRISETRERSRLKSVVNLMKPPGVGLIIRTEAKGQGENELFEDFEQLWDRWQTVVSDGEASIGPTLIYRDQDLLYRVIRDAYSHDVVEIIVDTLDGQRRAQEYLAGWASKQTKINMHVGEESLLVSKGIDREIEAALSDRVELPSGGHLNIEPTEALTVIDVNSGRFTSSRTQAETVRRTNLEAAQEISRQLRLRNIGGMVIVDFIDMDSRKDQQQVLEVFQRTLEEDRAKPQVGQLSDLGLVELTRRRQGQSLRELFTVHCESCSGLGFIPTLELGTPDNRKVISLKGKESDPLARGANRHAQRRMPKPAGTVMRAATAINGRVMPTMDDIQDFEETLAALPEHILEQMPDDLLVDKVPGKRGFSHDDEGELSDIDNEQEEEISFQPKSQIKDFEEEGDEGSHQLSDDLSENISAVARVFDEFDQSESRFGLRSQTSSFNAPSYEAPTALPEPAPVYEEESEETDFESEHGEEDAVAVEHHVEEAAPPLPEPESPFETEIDPVTGIYRLKAKTTGDEEHQQGEHEHGEHHHEHGEHHHEEHQHGEHHGEHQSSGESPQEATRHDAGFPSLEDKLEAARSIFQSTYSGEGGHEPQHTDFGNQTFPFESSADKENEESAESHSKEEETHHHSGEPFQLKLPTTEEDS
jgi:Rne/Rng family ribonuclease